MSNKVFISYSSIDEKWAKRVARTLSDIGVSYFLDRKDIAWGDDVIDRIAEGLGECSALIVIVSPASLRSQWVPFEIGQAKGLGKRILPFLTHPSLEIPSYLQQFHYKTCLAEVKGYLESSLAPQAHNKQKDKPSRKNLKKESHPQRRDRIPNIGYPVADVSGLWKYRCTTLDKEFDHGGFEHGGIVTIQQTKERFGVCIKLFGERLWIAYRVGDGEVSVSKLSTPIHWKVTNGSFTGETSIQFWYQSKDAHGIREGTTVGEIEIKSRRAVAIKGTFYYFDDSRMHGNIEMQPIKSKSNYGWGP